MAPKLMEMDEVVRMIHASAMMSPEDNKRTLLVCFTSSFSLTCFMVLKLVLSYHVINIHFLDVSKPRR